MDCSIYVAKTKALIGCMVTAQLICAYVFVYAKSIFSQDVAHLILNFYRFHSMNKIRHLKFLVLKA